MEKQIDKQKFMDFCSKAFDMNADIEISFYRSLNRTEEAAIELAEEFASIVGEQVEEARGTDYKSRWYKVRGKYSMTVWHQNSNDKKNLKEHLENLIKEAEELA